jgi:hypothetical protein
MDDEERVVIAVLAFVRVNATSFHLKRGIDPDKVHKWLGLDKREKRRVSLARFSPN